MAVRFSTGLRDKMYGNERVSIHFAIVKDTISFDSGSSEIRDSGNGFLSSGALVGDKVYARGTANNNTEFTITAATEGVLTVTPAPTTEAAGTVFALVAGTGGSLRDIMRNGVLRGYSGSQPTNADSAITTTKLLEFTVDGGAFVHGSADNGINFDESSLATLSKAANETWKATGLANGTWGFVRICANPEDDGSESTTLPRIDMSVGTVSGVDMLVATTTITTGKIHYINDGSFTFPYQYGA